MATGVRRISFANYQAGREPKTFIYEDDQCVVFEEEVNKQAPVHFLIVPKNNLPRLTDASMDEEKLLGHMLLVAKQVIKDMGLDRTGYHVMVDEEHSTMKLKSLHVFGRALHHMVWPVGPGYRL